MSMQFDYLKFKDTVHYIAHRCKGDELGRVKLHKSLYFADMIRFVASGLPLTGATYRKQPRGPMAVELGRALADLQAEGRISVESQPYFGFLKDVFRSRCDPDLARLSADEMALIDDIVAFTCRENSARSISELSHTAAWDAAENGRVMPYHQAYLMFGSDDYEDAADWAANEEALIETSSPRWLDHEAVRNFRGRIFSGRRSESLST